MPRRNTVKQYRPSSYYHIYNRGVNKRILFTCDEDRLFFMNEIIQRIDPTLSEPRRDGSAYPKFHKDVTLQAYCLMDNHFHFLVRTGLNPKNISKFFQSLFTSYSIYFNSRYGRIGYLFESRVKARKITTTADVMNISRYIHLNPSDYKHHRFSSYSYYVSDESPPWLKIQDVLKLFNGGSYKEFMEF